MTQHIKSWAPAALVLIAVVTGYVYARFEWRDGDLMDAVAAVQRHSPLFLVSEPRPTGSWVKHGCLYLSRTPRTAEAMELMSKYPARRDPRWAGVVCFRGTGDQAPAYVPWVDDGGDRCLQYDSFAVYGDPELLAEVRAALDREGFRPRQ
ncbi:MAG TPA: hypothetical protein VGF55_14920 [Gemmataceae bacterium]